MKFVAVDLGSSFIKAAVLDTDNFTLARQAALPAPPPCTDATGRFEVDADQLFGLARTIVDECLGRYGGDIAGIMLSTQMHGFVLADGQGRPLTNYVSWQDERCLSRSPTGESYLERLQGKISREDMQNTGVYLKAPLALCNLHTLLASGFTPPPGTNFCTLGSYVIFRLTGRNVCHITNAAPTGFADINPVGWNQGLIEKAGGCGLAFPELRDSLVPAGFYDYRGAAIPVYPDVGDQQASSLGCLARPDFDVNINIGTAAQISIISSQFSQGCYEVRPYFGPYYLKTISRMPGGRNLDVLIEFIRDIGVRVYDAELSTEEVWERIKRLPARQANGLRVNTSFFKTLAADQGAITAISNANLSLEALFAAAFEDFAATYGKFIGKLGQEAVQRIVFSGGVAAKNPRLLAAITRKTGLPGVMPPMTDEVFVGLFRLALVAGGYCPSIEETCDMLLQNRDENHIRLKVL